MHDYIPPIPGLILALILWAVLIFGSYRKEVKMLVHDFFAWRRHVRREKRRKEKEREADYAYMRAYAEKDLESMMNIYNIHTGEPVK